MAETTIYTNSLSLETQRLCRVVGKLSGSYVNPTADAVQAAFLISGKPASGDWKTAAWETDATITPTAYYITCLVGPGGTFVPAVGAYSIWVKFTDSLDIPVRQVGTLVVE